MIFFLANLVLLGMSLANLAGLLTGRTPSIHALVLELAAEPVGRRRLSNTIALAIGIQLYMYLLLLPVQETVPALALPWSFVLLLSTMETIYTSRRLREVVKTGLVEGDWDFYASWRYRGLQILVSGMTAVVCAALLID